MKKKIFLAICISALTVFSAVAFAASDGEVAENITVSFSDVDKNSKYYDAVTNIAQIGIMSGYENGTFKPYNNITRAEFSAIVCRLSGIDDEKLNKNNTIFSDVPNSHWASGIIAKAVDLGIISGYGNGKFGPSDNVLYEQTIKMLVCAEEKDSDAKALGGYPDGYISVAKNCGYLKGVSSQVSKPINRGDISKILNNILNQRENAYVNAKDDKLSIIID